VANTKPNENQSDEKTTDESKGKSSNEEPKQVDLADEAGKAASNAKPSDDKTRSLDELELDAAARAKIDSYVNKAINDAVAKHDRRTQKKLDDEGYMTEAEVQNLLAKQEADASRRIAARENFLSVLGSEGINVGSEGYRAVQAAYSQGIEDGDFTPHLLLTDAGIRTLIAIAGVSNKAAGAAGPQAGTQRKAPAGSILGADGSLQLNAKKGDDSTLSEKVRQAVGASYRNLNT